MYLYVIINILKHILHNQTFHLGGPLKARNSHDLSNLITTNVAIDSVNQAKCRSMEAMTLKSKDYITAVDQSVVSITTSDPNSVHMIIVVTTVSHWPILSRGTKRYE